MTRSGVLDVALWQRSASAPRLKALTPRWPGPMPPYTDGPGN